MRTDLQPEYEDQERHLDYEFREFLTLSRFKF
jgi:hypothetical protein